MCLVALQLGQQLQVPGVPLYLQRHMLAYHLEADHGAGAHLVLGACQLVQPCAFAVGASSLDRIGVLGQS